MTKEDKELLLKDLCTRLPYGVKGIVYAETTNGQYDINGDLIFFDTKFNVELDSINTSTEEIHVVAIGNEDTVTFIEEQQKDGAPYVIDEFKPYLRPMSSMTEEEKEEWNSYVSVPYDKSLRRTPYCIKYMDWLLEHHFDFRHLIEKDLALEAQEGMYDIKEK